MKGIHLMKDECANSSTSKTLSQREDTFKELVITDQILIQNGGKNSQGEGHDVVTSESGKGSSVSDCSLDQMDQVQSEDIEEVEDDLSSEIMDITGAEEDKDEIEKGVDDKQHPSMSFAAFARTVQVRINKAVILLIAKSCKLLGHLSLC